MHQLIERAGEAPFPLRIQRTLAEPINDRIVSIRPDGLIYVSHAHYRDRLDRAFGVGGWALVPLAAPRVTDNRVLYYGFLKARGQFVADAVGGSQYYPNNRQGNYDNSVEAAKSDCLVRCCKALPMFRECWDQEYADYWKSTYAHEVADGNQRGARVWKKSGEAMRTFDTRPGRQAESAYDKPPSASADAQGQREVLVVEHREAIRLPHPDAYTDASDDDFADDSRLREEAERNADF